MSTAGIRKRTVQTSENSNKNQIINMNQTDNNDESTGFIVNKNRVKLYKYNEIPDWQKDNHYILDGYVKETNSYSECCRSLTYMHNESINIYTHFLPGLIIPILLLLIYPFINSSTSLLKFSPVYIPIYENTTTIDYFVFYLFIFGFMSCLSLSASFHCLKCHSLEVSIFGNKLDYVGIVLLIVTSMVGIIYFSLIDHLKAAYTFIGLTLLFGTICTVLSVDSNFRTPEWRPFRATMFVIFGLSSIFPIFYGFFSFGVSETFKRSGLIWVLLEGVGYIFGAFLYAARIPEKYNPGYFDIWGNSHQLFHVLVVLSAFSHYKGLIESYKYAHQFILN